VRAGGVTALAEALVSSTDNEVQLLPLFRLYTFWFLFERPARRRDGSSHVLSLFLFSGLGGRPGDAHPFDWYWYAHRILVWPIAAQPNDLSANEKGDFSVTCNAETGFYSRKVRARM